METSKVQFLNECKIKLNYIKKKNKTKQTFKTPYHLVMMLIQVMLCLSIFYQH